MAAEQITIAELFADLIFRRDDDDLVAFERRVAGVGRTLTKVGAGLTSVGALSVNAARRWEDAFTGVRKTVDASELTLLGLERGLRRLGREEIPLAFPELAAIAEGAGQLGIAVDNIEEFTRVMAMLRTTTNLEEPGTQLARFANITRMSADDYERLGSTVVHLGNNMATTESEIVYLGLRLARAGKQVDLTESQILGLSAAMNSVGIEAEMGSTAMGRVFLEMQAAVQGSSSESRKQLREFAKTSNMTADEFRTAFEDDATGALLAFLDGLNELKAEKDLHPTLEELGFQAVRVRDVLLTLSGASDLVRRGFDLAATGWEENTALAEEAELRYQTFSSQISFLRNRVQDAAISVGQTMIPTLKNLIDRVSEGAEWFRELSPGVKEFTGKVLLAGPAVLALGLALTVGSRAISPFYYGLMNLYTYPWGRMVTKIGQVSTAAKGLLVGMGPAGWIVAAVAGLALLVLHWDEVRDALARATEAVRNFFDEEERAKRLDEENREREATLVRREIQVLETLIDADVTEYEGRDIEEVLAGAREQLANLEAGFDADAAANAVERNRKIIVEHTATLADLDRQIDEVEGEEVKEFTYGRYGLRKFRKSDEEIERDQLDRRERLTALREERAQLVLEVAGARDALEEVGVPVVPPIEPPAPGETPPPATAGAGTLTATGGLALGQLLGQHLRKAAPEPPRAAESALVAPGVPGIPGEPGEPGEAVPGLPGEPGQAEATATVPEFEIPALDQVPPIIESPQQTTTVQHTSNQLSVGTIEVHGTGDPEETAEMVRDRLLDEFEDMTDDARQPAF